MKRRSTTRRDFLRLSGGGILFPFLFNACSPEVAKQQRSTESPPRSGRIVFRGGTILTMDPKIGMIEGDLLVEEGVISEIAPSIETDAEQVDARDRIILPGFVDTHRHLWQGVLRCALPDGTLADYMRLIAGQARPVFHLEDAYAGNLISALGALDAGVTTVLDWSHIGNSPEHTDAAVRALRESGIRAVYAYGSGSDNPLNRFPDDIRRVRRELVPENDPMITLAMGAGIRPADWDLARSVGARISVHVNGTGDLLPVAGHLGEDVTCVHGCRLNQREWELLSEKGVGVSISAPVEMIMGHGVPPIRQVLQYGILPSLSVDVETTVPGDMFTQMQSVYTLQRMQVHASELEESEGRNLLLSPADVLTFATRNGAVHNGLDGVVGSLTPGKAADLILLDRSLPHAAPANDPAGAVVCGMDRSCVESVMVAGTFRKWRHRLLLGDPDKVVQMVTDSRDGIYRRAGWL